MLAHRHLSDLVADEVLLLRGIDGVVIPLRGDQLLEGRLLVFGQEVGIREGLQTRVERTRRAVGLFQNLGDVSVVGAQQQGVLTVAVQTREHEAQTSVVERLDLFAGESLALRIEQFVLVHVLDLVGAEQSVGHRFDLFAVGVELGRIVRRDALAGKFVRSLEPHGEDHRLLVSLGDEAERDEGIGAHRTLLVIDTSYKRVFARLQILDADGARFGDLPVERIRILLVGIHVLSLQVGLAIVHGSLEDRILHRTDVGCHRGADFNYAVGRFALRKRYRVVGNHDTRQQDAEHARTVAVVECAGCARELEHDALYGEGDDAVYQRAILAGGLIHREVFGHVRCDANFAVGRVERQTGRLVGNVDLLGIACIDDRIDVAAFEGYRCAAGQCRNQILAVYLHAVVARNVRTLVDLHFDFRIGVEAGGVERVEVADDLIAPFALGGRAVFAFHQFPSGADHRERESGVLWTVERDVVRILDADVARVGRTLGSLVERHLELGFRFSGTEHDRIDFKNALLARRDDDGDRDGLGELRTAHLVGDFRLFRGIDLDLRRGGLGREIDAVVVRVLFGSGRVGRVVRASGECKGRQQCPNDIFECLHSNLF